MSITYQTIMDAIVAAVATTSGLSADRILWGFQPIGEPQLDDPIDTPTGKTTYIKLAIGGLVEVGTDYVRTTYDAAAPAGQEISAQPMGTRELPLEMQVFTTSTADSNAAVFLADQVKMGFSLPQVADPLAAVGVTMFDGGRVNYAPSVVNANFRGRATCTLRMYAPAIAVAQLYGYIAEAAGTTTISGGKQTTATKAYDIPFDAPNKP